MVGIISILLTISIFVSIRLYENTQRKMQGYLLKIHSKVDYIEGLDTRGEITIKLYPDKITFNDLATIPIEKVTKVDRVHQFIRQKGGRRYYYVLPYFHDMTIHFKSSEGYNKQVRLEKEGKTSIGFTNLRETILKLKGMEEKPTEQATKPFEM